MGDKHIREQLAALEEFGFDLVDLDKPGAPTPGRIADRLTAIEKDIKNAIQADDSEQFKAALRRLGRLWFALEVWDLGMMKKTQ